MRFDTKPLRKLCEREYGLVYQDRFPLEQVHHDADKVRLFIETAAHVPQIEARMLGNRQVFVETQRTQDEEIHESPALDQPDTLATIKARRGQADFRKRLMSAYDCRCAVTGCAVEELLEAAHITPHKDKVDYRTSNGLLLRVDIHRLYDLDLLQISENGLLELDSTLQGDPHYGPLQDRPEIRVPQLGREELEEWKRNLERRYWG